MTFTETEHNRDTVGRFSDKVGSAPDVSLAYTDSNGRTTAGVSEARATAIFEDLMEEHGLIEDGWEFGFDRATSRVGLCDYSKKRISFSQPLLHAMSAEQVRQTALHEIAHAKTKGRGHGAAWKAYARAIGYTGQRCAEQNEAIRQVQHEKRQKNAKSVAYAPDGTPVYTGDTFSLGMKRYTIRSLQRTNATIVDQDGEEGTGAISTISKLLREKDGRQADPTKRLSKEYPAHGLKLTVGDRYRHHSKGIMVVDDLMPKTIVLAADNGQLYGYTPSSMSRMPRDYS